MGLPLSQISLRERETALLTGGTQVGKTTLADWLGADFLDRYKARKGRRLISDTKPRYRAQWLPTGRSAAHLYRKWDHGQFIPDSVLVTNPTEMRDAFLLGHSTAIVSSKGWAEMHDACIDAFLEDSRRGRPQLLQVDETCDHFHGNGMPKGSGALVVVSRAGAERGTAGLYCTQRTKGISPHLMEHMRRLYAFEMDVAADAKRFAEFGCPIGPNMLPETRYLFLYWTKDAKRLVWGPYKLNLAA